MLRQSIEVFQDFTPQISFIQKTSKIQIELNPIVYNQHSNPKMRKDYNYLKQPDEYEITMGTYKPHFRGKPEDYWETTYFDFFSAIFAMLFIIALFVGISVLIVNWVFQYGTYSYSLSLSIATVVFVAIFFVLNYFMSRDKRKRQKQVMNKALRQFRRNEQQMRNYQRDNSCNDSENQKIYNYPSYQNLFERPKRSID